MTHGRPLSRPPALGSSPSEGAAAAPGHCGDSRRNDYANPRSPLPLSRGWQLMLRDACGLIATPLPGWPAATPPSRAIAASRSRPIGIGWWRNARKASKALLSSRGLLTRVSVRDVRTERAEPRHTFTQAVLLSHPPLPKRYW